MRLPPSFVLPLAVLGPLLFTTTHALADEPAPGDAPPATAPAPAPAPPDLPAPAPVAQPALAPPAASLSFESAPIGADAPPNAAATDDGKPSRAEGIRLGLELGFERAFSGNKDRLNEGSPTLLPIGFDVSFRTSKTFLVGFQGYAALASRDDCISNDSCRARAYALGGHVEGMLARGSSYVTYLRYAVAYEVLYQGGQILDPSGHVYRGALDLLDFRFGTDFTVSHGTEGRTVRIGPYLGLVGGFLMSQSGITHVNGQPRDLSRDSGSPHLWFSAGVRGNLDP